MSNSANGLPYYIIALFNFDEHIPLFGIKQMLLIWVIAKHNVVIIVHI